MSQYNNVVIFGVEQMMEQLESKLESELVPGSVVVACRYTVLCTVQCTVYSSTVTYRHIFLSTVNNVQRLS